MTLYMPVFLLCSTLLCYSSSDKWWLLRLLLATPPSDSLSHHSLLSHSHPSSDVSVSICSSRFSHLSITHSLVPMTLGTEVSPTVHPFAQTSLLAHVHSNESLVCFNASGFCYTVSTGSSPQLCLDILLLPWVTVAMQLCFCWTYPFTHSSSSRMR